jgi:hypothetical protein
MCLGGKTKRESVEYIGKKEGLMVTPTSIHGKITVVNNEEQ